MCILNTASGEPVTDGENCGAPFLQLAQIVQPLLQSAQLRFVERPGRLFPIVGDERHRCTTIEWRHGSFNLLLSKAERALSVDECLSLRAHLLPKKLRPETPQPTALPNRKRIWSIIP